MTRSQIKRYQPTSYVKSLFDRCWKMYESKNNVKISTWHKKHPDMYVMINRLKLLSDFWWTFSNIFNIDTAIEDEDKFILRFKSFEELELKLTIAGY